jgi:hypothetical protein
MHGACTAARLGMLFAVRLGRWRWLLFVSHGALPHLTKCSVSLSSTRLGACCFLSLSSSMIFLAPNVSSSILFSLSLLAGPFYYFYIAPSYLPRPVHVFVSGLERGPEASGIDHGNMFSSLSGGLEELRGQVEARLQQVRAGLARAPVDAHILNRFIVGLVASGLQITFNVGRVLVTRFPLLWPVALTGFVFFRKVFAPLRASRLSWEEWVEHAREETESQQRKGDTWTWSDDFVYEEKKWSQEDERRRQQQQQAKHRTQAQQNKARHSFDHMTPYQVRGELKNFYAQQSLTSIMLRCLRFWASLKMHRRVTSRLLSAGNSFYIIPICKLGRLTRKRHMPWREARQSRKHIGPYAERVEGDEI